MQTQRPTLLSYVAVIAEESESSLQRSEPIDIAQPGDSIDTMALNVTIKLVLLCQMLQQHINGLEQLLLE